MPAVVVLDLEASSVLSVPGVNESHAVLAQDLTSAVTFGSLALYTKPAAQPKGPVELPYLPISIGYAVEPVSDFTQVRHSGGTSWFTQNRHASPKLWKVRATLVLPTADEYTAVVDLLMSGRPFETSIVTEASPAAVGDPGSPHIGWPVPASVKLGSANWQDYRVSLEFYAEKV